MTSVLSILNEIAANPSTKAKEAIILREKDNLALQLTFASAYDPTISYYIRKIPEYTNSGSKMDLLYALSAIENLSSRKVTGDAASKFLAGILSNISKDDATVIERVIGRDLKCGASDSLASRDRKSVV